jgi:hypothetical protein
MAIKGLSDRGLALPEIGTIRKGAKKPAKGPGAELSYFRFDYAEGEKGAEKVIFQKYGEKPNNLSVLLPFNDVERSWDPWMEAYTAGRMVGRSDGEYVQYLVDTSTGEVKVANGLDVKTGQKFPHPKDNVAGFDYQNKPVLFKNNGRLKVIVRDLGRAAIFVVLTTSTHDIINISAQLAGYRHLNNGQLAGIPFVLRRVPKMVSTPGENGQRVRRKKYLISIEVDPRWANAKFGELSSLALPQLADMEPIAGELPAGALQTDFDEDEILEGEGAEQQPAEPAFMKDPEPEKLPEKKLPEKKLVDPMGSEAVAYAAKFWNMENAQAAQEISKKNLGSRIAWNDFLEVLGVQF